MAKSTLLDRTLLIAVMASSVVKLQKSLVLEEGMISLINFCQGSMAGPQLGMAMMLMVHRESQKREAIATRLLAASKGATRDHR
jgi:hypothetical protein